MFTMKNLNAFDVLALILLIIGGINWGMIGIFDVDLVGSLFGVMTVLTRAVYALVGVSALYSVYILVAKT
jgi:uncharacterized membrane protein YuzA (DUF378 family)